MQTQNSKSQKSITHNEPLRSDVLLSSSRNPFLD